MNVLVVDNIARGHALVSKIAESPKCNRLWMTPGNAVTEQIAELALGRNGKPIATTDVAELAWFAQEYGIGLTIASSDDSLAAGITDVFKEKKLTIFGPSLAATEIESSKVFARVLENELNISIAPSGIFENYDKAVSYAKGQQPPWFVKEDGIAQGKGASKAEDLESFENRLRELIITGKFDVNKKVLIESGLEGPEISLHAWCDGETYRMFPFAMQDHKTIYENGRGPMTGGMGVIAPVPGIMPKDVERLGRQFVAPVLEALKAMGRPFKGILYPGLILTAEGPKLLEYNARPGGPETEAWVPLLKSDITMIMMACVKGELAKLPVIRWRRAATACIVLAAGGYPDQPRANAVINGLEVLRCLPDLEVFHYATRKLGGHPVVNSGRVLSIVAVGKKHEPLEEVIKRGYEAAANIQFLDEYGNDTKQMRRDIGATALCADFQERVAATRHLF